MWDAGSISPKGNPSRPARIWSPALRHVAVGDGVPNTEPSGCESAAYSPHLMAKVLASFFGTGLILGKIRGSDSGSGTVGGAVAFLLAMLIGNRWGWGAVLAGAVVLIVVGLWASHRLVGDNGDAGWIVIDEAAGAFIAVIGIVTWPVAFAAFAVFRLADIVKGVFPGVAAGERMPGAVGVMADDVVAGLYGLAVGHLIQAFL